MTIYIYVYIGTGKDKIM